MTDWEVIGDAEPSDEEITALARFLLTDSVTKEPINMSVDPEPSFSTSA